MFTIVLLITFALFCYMIMDNKASRERVRQAGIAHQQKLEQEKIDEAKRLEDAAQRLKAAQDAKLKNSAGL